MLTFNNQTKDVSKAAQLLKMHSAIKQQTHSSNSSPYNKKSSQGQHSPAKRGWEQRGSVNALEEANDEQILNIPIAVEDNNQLIESINQSPSTNNSGKKRSLHLHKRSNSFDYIV